MFNNLFGISGYGYTGLPLTQQYYTNIMQKKKDANTVEKPQLDPSHFNKEDIRMDTVFNAQNLGM